MSEIRREDPPLISGAGRYVGDHIDGDTLHCWFVRSPVAHGTLTGIDVEDARTMPGVVGVFTAADLDLPDIPGSTGRGPEALEMTRPPLARDRVRHVGDPMAVVVATEPRLAEDAAGMIWADIEERDAVTTPEAALAGDVVLFESAGDNVVAKTHLEEGPVADAPPAVSATVVVQSQRLSPTAIEPLAILARPEDGRLRVICSHQAAHRLVNHIAQFAGIPREEIHVTVPDVGGAFGMKGMLFPEYLVVATLARRLGRPVVWTQARREQFVAGTHGRSMRHTMRLDGDADGTIRRLHVDLVADVGAYPHNGSQIPLFTRLVSAGPYRIPRLEFDTTTVVTNLAPTGSYRGAGRPEAALALERAIDGFARAAGIDPYQVRLHNMIPQSELPTTSPTGAIYDSGDYAGALRKAAGLVDLEGVRREQAEARATGANPIGIGFGAFIERAGGAIHSGEYAKVEVVTDPPGIVVRTGSIDSGQGHATTWTTVVDQIFGTGNVTVLAGDTDEVADGIGTFASRSVQIGASAALRMSREVLATARTRAAEHLEASEADLVYSAGTFQVAGSPGAEVSLWTVAAEEPLEAEEMFVPGAQTFPYGVHIAVVEVERETGEVHIRKIVAVDDCGTVINEMIVEGQLHGSLAQGVGQALYEEIRYDDFGQPVTASMMDYSIPTAADVPPIISDRLETPAPSNPLGAKGTGEAGCIGGPPAILNAVLDALAPDGVTDLQLPLRPSKIWQALRDANG